MIYFYPKDSTSGCTKQAQAYSQRLSEFEAAGYRVFGVSKDSVASHKRFEEKYELTITLLSDVEKAAITAFDVWQEKKNYGKVIHGCGAYQLCGGCGWDDPVCKSQYQGG